MTTPNSTPPAKTDGDAIDQAVLLLQKFSHGDALTQTDPDVFDQSDATALLASVGIAIAEQLRRIADSIEVRHE